MKKALTFVYVMIAAGVFVAAFLSAMEPRPKQKPEHFSKEEETNERQIEKENAKTKLSNDRWKQLQTKYKKTAPAATEQ